MCVCVCVCVCLCVSVCVSVCVCVCLCEIEEGCSKLIKEAVELVTSFFADLKLQSSVNVS